MTILRFKSNQLTPAISSIETVVCFFFQAEDGIRDADVTGVQTCALPIWSTCRGLAVVMVCRDVPREDRAVQRVGDDARGAHPREPDCQLFERLCSLRSRAVGPAHLGRGRWAGGLEQLTAEAERWRHGADAVAHRLIALEQGRGEDGAERLDVVGEPGRVAQSWRCGVFACCGD